MLEPDWFLVKRKGQSLTRKEFLFIDSFWLASFCNLLAGDVQVSVTTDRHVQLASVYSLEACLLCVLGFLLLAARWNKQEQDRIKGK